MDATKTPKEMSPKLSLVLCARNDAYQGNSLWRLNTAVNYVAERARELGVAGEVEVVVVDWGSESPLSRAAQLSPEASQITSFLWVAPERARSHQKDSPFAEVIALNAGIRRARGDYVGRIDQDTLVGKRFLEWFFGPYLGGETTVPSHGILLSNRRGIPYRFADACPSFAAVERYVDTSGPTRPLAWPQPEHLYYRSPIGLLVMHRDLWNACHGYDESMIYFNYMEWDLVLRLKERYPFVNLGREVDHAFFHLDHEHPLRRWGAKGRKRKMNPVRDEESNPPPLFAPSSPDWGLLHEPVLTFESASPSPDWRVAGGSGSGSSGPAYSLLRLRVGAHRFLDAAIETTLRAGMAMPRTALRWLPKPAQERALAARRALELEPLHKWPSILLAELRGARSTEERAESLEP